ncbi:MAG: hypothetical protein E4H03_12150 [Myxococcales bacterium]|jgi:hypothetical protein|nr:MAG: hypothetical protein E4H03_12150 [Myxococcales bacterium]
MKSSIVLAFVLVACCAGVAAAGSYVGYSDTGYGNYSKRNCCEQAVIAAQEDSARGCQRTGGFPDYKRDASRGSCKWERKRDAQSRWIYRCTGTATVLCR